MVLRMGRSHRLHGKAERKLAAAVAWHGMPGLICQVLRGGIFLCPGVLRFSFPWF
jgi:hypothetical protein